MTSYFADSTSPPQPPSSRYSHEPHASSECVCRASHATTPPNPRHIVTDSGPQPTTRMPPRPHPLPGTSQHSPPHHGTPPPPEFCLTAQHLLGGGRTSDVLERLYTVGGRGGTSPDPPYLPPLGPPPPPPLPMFEADSQNFASAPSVPRGFKLQNFRPSFGGDHRGTEGGGGVRPKPPPPPSDPLPPLPPPLLILPWV